jgi:cytochrome c oxidase subunit 3
LPDCNAGGIKKEKSSAVRRDPCVRYRFHGADHPLETIDLSEELTMQAPATTIHEIPAVGPNVVRFGMLTFLASEAMLFAGLICGYMVLRGGAGAGWQMPEALKNAETMIKTIIATLCLISSSFTLHFAEARLIKHTKGGIGLLLLTILLGALFLTNQALEWISLHNEGFWFNTTGIMGSSFFVLTGFHGLHVFIGVLLLISSLVKALGGKFTPQRHGFLECTGLYWHFVDIVWVFLFSILYIL